MKKCIVLCLVTILLALPGCGNKILILIRLSLSIAEVAGEVKRHRRNEWGYSLNDSRLYKPYFGPNCENCGMRLTCNGCNKCGKCGNYE